MSYYDLNADEFYKKSIDANLSDLYSEFLPLIDKGGRILDAGCGSGRDSKYFLDNGYKVDAFDASQTLVEMASNLTGIKVKCHKFIELDSVEKYDAIWACASLLCLNHNELADNINHLSSFLKLGGIFCMSFKHGDNEIDANERHYNNMNEDKLNILLPDLKLSHQKTWISKDALGRVEMEWFNIILA